MPYAELHCHSAYSFLDGASHPVELAAAAAEQGHESLALTDHDGLHGAMEMAQALKPLGVRSITGAELTLDDGHHLTLLCQTRTGYTNLCRLITAAHWPTRRWAREGWSEPVAQVLDGRRPAQDALDTDPSVTLADVERHAEGLVCLSGCARDGAVAARIERAEYPEAAAVARRLLAAFGPDRFRLELQRPYWRHDRRRNKLLAELAGRLGVPCVATGNVHVHSRERTPLQDAMVAVRLGATLDETEPRRRGNSSHVLTPPERMAERFRDHPEAVAESGRLAERLTFDLTEDLGYRYPGSEDPDADRKLAELCAGKLAERYPRAGAATARLEEELRVISHLRLSGFFLLHRDMLELAREVALEVRGPESARRLLPPGRGRGSSVSSIVCYLTGLSHIDPIENELCLGRFLNEELTALPDIDLDFPRDIRDVLIPRVHDRYGRDRCALVAAFSTFMVRSAVRDFAKALGLPPGEIERLARAVDPWKERNDIEGDVPEPTRRSPRWDALVKLARDAWGLPRHQSQHPGGMVISTQPLDRPLPGAAGLDGGAPDGAVGQGLLRGRRLPQDRPARPRHAVGGRALRGRDRARARRAHRPVAHPLRRPGGLRARPGGGDDGRVPDRVARPDADAQAHAAGEPRRPHRPGGAGAARADPGRRGPSLHRAAQGAARGPRASRSPTSIPRSSRCCATRSARSSSRTRCWRWPRPSPASAWGRRRACAAR